MSPARVARRRRGRLALKGILAELGGAAALCALGCFLCVLAYTVGRQLP